MSKSVKLRDLVVLGLLKESPRYGYEIKMIIDNVMSHVIDVSSGSLYYGLKRLQERGFVEESSVEKIGRRPERSVYKVTDAGLGYLDAELPRVVFPRSRPYFPLDLALYFFQFIDPEEQVRRLKMRNEYLKLSIDYVSELQVSLKERVPENQLFIFTHRIRYITMEMNFISEVIEKLTDVSYELSKSDWYEIHREIEELKKQLKVEIILPDPSVSPTG